MLSCAHMWWAVVTHIYVGLRSKCTGGIHPTKLTNFQGCLLRIVFTARKRSCWRVMFSEAFVCPQGGLCHGDPPAPVMVEEWPVRILLECILVVMLITGRNEVVAKVMFLHVSVILLTGGVSRQAPPGPGRPPGQGEPPPPGPGNPPGPGPPPGTRQTPQAERTAPRDQADPPGNQTAAYGQWAAGTHPTGMHSCFW